MNRDDLIIATAILGALIFFVGFIIDSTLTKIMWIIKEEIERRKINEQPK